MDLQNLPRFPGQYEEEFREKNELLLKREGILCVLFEFGIGLALTNVFFMVLLAAYSDAPFWVALEAALVFSVFGFLVILSLLPSVTAKAEAAYDERGSRGAGGLVHLAVALIALAALVGAGLGFGFAWVFTQGFRFIEAVGRPIQGPLDNLLAAALGGGLVAMLAGSGLVLAGGTPEHVGKMFCLLGKISPWIIRSCFFRKGKKEIQLRARPLLEGTIWFALVVGPLVRLLW